MKVYKVSVEGSFKDNGDPYNHKWDFGSEYYLNIEDAIERKEQLCHWIEARNRKFYFANRNCYLVGNLNSYTRVDVDHAYDMKSTYYFNGGKSDTMVSIEPIDVVDRE